MHDERLSNLHPGWVAVGFVVAVGVTALLHLALVATGFLAAGTAETIANGTAILVGFFAGGYFVGLRWPNAPLLNALALLLLSAALWFASATLGAPAVAHLRVAGAQGVLGSLLLQLAGVVAGAFTGRWSVRTGHVPEPDRIPPEL